MSLNSHGLREGRGANFLRNIALLNSDLRKRPTSRAQTLGGDDGESKANEVRCRNSRVTS